MTDDTIDIPLVPECSECIIDSLGLLIPLLTDNKEEQYGLFRRAYDRIATGYKKRESPLELSIELYQELYKWSGKEDPYAEIKKRSNVAAEKVLPLIEDSISKMDGYEKLRGAVAAAITGNFIDFNTAGHNPNLEELAKVFDEVVEEGFAIDHSESLWESIISRKGDVVFLADNTGETLLDVPLLRIFKDYGWHVIYAVKGKPLINDAVRADVEDTEVDNLAEIIDSGAWAYGVPKRWVSKEFIDRIRNSEMVISKGQANIESFPEIQREIGIETYYITRGKCAHISKSIGAKIGDNIVLRHPKP